MFASLGAVTARHREPRGRESLRLLRDRIDAFYNHCTSDGSRVVIKVEVARAPDYEWCVGPGRTWLGSAARIQGAHYTGRLC